MHMAAVNTGYWDENAGFTPRMRLNSQRCLVVLMADESDELALPLGH